ncbi:MAG: uridine kinase, partial [Bdellovibrionota bacterium]
GAVFPLCDAIVAAKKKHKMILGVSGGTRMRHTLAIGLDLGLPTGGLAQVVGAVEEQNAALLQAILSKNGGIGMPREHFPELALYLEIGIIPIVICMPPYHFWEEPPEEGRIPMNGPDVGLYLTAEVLGAKNLIFLKDQKGLYTDDPATNPKAKFIPQATADEILSANYPELIIEEKVLHYMKSARHIRQIQIVNGLEPALLERAMNGEHVGTIIRAG